MLNPIDIEKVSFRTTFLQTGYNEKDVDSFLDKLYVEYEKLHLENQNLKEEIAELEEEILSFKKKSKGEGPKFGIETRGLFGEILAQSLAGTETGEIIALAQLEAGDILQKAHDEVNALFRDVEVLVGAERAKVEEIKEQKKFLRSQLNSLLRSFGEVLDEEFSDKNGSRRNSFIGEREDSDEKIVSVSTWKRNGTEK